MRNYSYSLYLFTLLASLVISLVLTPLVRLIALRLKILDVPHSDIKTHKDPVPYFGGVAIFAGWLVSLLLVRFFTDFPTGTLHTLRGILLGSALVFILGLVDDIVPKGIGFRSKFLVQALAALVVIFFDVRIHFITPNFIAIIASLVWIIGITNAFNIIDIMDGLSGGIAVIAGLAFLLIALPSEAIYVNFCAAALAGGILGFLPYNLSKKLKIFMGDTGSLTLGFVLAALSLGTSYTKINYIGIFSPLLILAIPIYDTMLVIFLRIRKGMSPFLGSKDHFALRLEKVGFSRKKILVIAYSASFIFSLSAYLITRISVQKAIAVFCLMVVASVLTAYRLGKVKMD